MTPETWTRVTALFEHARGRPAREREAWLLRECPEASIRAEVLALLAEYDSEPGFLETPIDAAAVTETLRDHARQTLEGRRFGVYRLVREVGRGGMGVVYEAVRDDEEFDRRVAIKLLPSAWSAPAFVERFRFERQVLAGLDHPGIARLIDAGTTDDGVPYLVMDFVGGQPIDAWCRDQGLSTRQRVALVHRVCAAVEHAHQNLVVHRDIKPANILVTPSGEPRLLDFGIATVVGPAEGLSPGLTKTGQHGFTTEYASPEQIRGERVTTATDVYSLGVLLYLLLADRPPYVLAGLSPVEAMRVACDVDPPPPSRVAPEAAAAGLRGDLDNIILKALRKDPRARYPSVALLSADLQAWLHGAPVSATPAILAYRARRYVARHRLGVAAATAVVVALVAGGSTAAWQAHIARVERDKAQNRFRQVQQFSRSLLFDVHEALRGLPGATEPRRVLLERAVQFLDGLAADAGDDAAMKVELAQGYRRLGQVQGSPVSDNVGDVSGARRSFETAARLADEALAIDPTSGAAVNAVAGAYDDLSVALNRGGDVDAAERAFERHRDAIERLEREHGGEPGIPVAIASSYLNLGYFRGGQRGDRAGAREFYEKAVRLYDALPQTERERDDVVLGHARALKRLGAIHVAETRLDQAEDCYRKALAFEEAVVARSPGDASYRYEVTFSLSDLGLIARKRGDLATAESMYLRALRSRQAALAADPKNVRVIKGVLFAHRSLATTYYHAGRHAEQLAQQRATLPVLDQWLAVHGPTTEVQSFRAWGWLNVAAALLDLAEHAPPAERASSTAEARTLFQRAESTARALEKGPFTDPDFTTLFDQLRTRLATPR